MVISKNIIAVPPGETIKEQLGFRGISQKEFAVRMGMSEKHISNLINGEVQLTPDVALRLEMVLGTPAQFWSNLEAIYRNDIALAKNENNMDADISILAQFPYKQMAKNGWVSKTNILQKQVISLRKFFEVVSLDLVCDSRLNNIVCMGSSANEKNNYSLLAWAQKAKIEARSIDVASINIKKLKSKIEEIKQFSKVPFNIYYPKLVSILSGCGIALVLLPQIDGLCLQGATFLDNNKIVLCLTNDTKNADIFFTSLFHELAHIILGHVNRAATISKKDEEAADLFAKNALQ